MKKFLLCVIFILFFVSSAVVSGFANAANKGKTHAVYFYAETCPNCQKIKPFIEKTKNRYKDRLDFSEYDVIEKEENRQLFDYFAAAYNVSANEAKVPIVFIGGSYLSGRREIKSELKERIDQAISNNEELLFDQHKFFEDWPNVKKLDFVVSDGRQSREDSCSIVADSVCGDEKESRRRDGDNGIETSAENISLALIITTALIDSLNPCAIAVLVFLLGILASLESSKGRIIKIGIVYISAVFATYYLAGLGLINVITQFDMARQVSAAAGIIVLFAGLLQIKEGLYPDGGQLLVIPKRTKPFFTSLMKKGTSLSVFAAGVLVSAFELPCTGQVYLGILSMLSQENFRTQGYIYLFIYNLIFVLPLVVILIVGAFGFDARRIENMRKQTRTVVKISIGIIMIVLGVFLLYSPF